MFLDRVIYFGEVLGVQEKGRSPKKLESLVDVPYVAHLKVHILSYNMILISSPYRVPRLSCVNMNLIFLRSVFIDQVNDFGKNFGR